MLKPIEHYDGYFVSEDGKVYCNLGKGCRDRTKTVDLYEIKPRPTKNGYLRVCARNTSTNKRTDLYIHRLVAQYFIPNQYCKPQINHKNCDRTDNKVENLEWCTPAENNEYTMRVGHVMRDKMSGRYVSVLN
jgi:hypothetical protein